MGFELARAEASFLTEQLARALKIKVDFTNNLLVIFGLNYAYT
jgi:hypothetical protein